MAVGTNIRRKLRMATLFAEEPLPLASKGQRRTAIRTGCRVPAFRTLDQRCKTANVEKKHGVLAAVVDLPEEAHRGCEEYPRRPGLSLRGSVLTPNDERGRHIGRVFHLRSQRRVCRNATRVEH